LNGFFILKSVLLLIALGLSVVSDLRERKIRNWVTLPAAAAGVLVNVCEHGPDGLLMALEGWLAPVLLLSVLFCINVMGAGDIKLFGAIGAIMGLPFVMYSFVFSVYAGGLVAVVILFRRKEFCTRMKYLFNYCKFALFFRGLPAYCSQGDTTAKFPFSPAIVSGTLLQLFLVLQKL